MPTTNQQLDPQPPPPSSSSFSDRYSSLNNPHHNTILYEKAKRRLKLETPASQAVTYSQIELPYHAPPIIYKISYNSSMDGKDDDGSNNINNINNRNSSGVSATLFERVDTWKGSKEELRVNEKALARIRQDQIVFQQQNSNNLSSGIENNDSTPKTSISSHVTNNIGDFLAYFFLKGNYPNIEWKPIGLLERNSETLLANLFTKEHSMLDKKANYMWVIDANLNFIFAPEHQVDFALQRIRVKHGDLTATGKTMMGSVENMTVGRLPARIGGEFRWDESKGTWRIDNDSSYCFFREDELVISNTAKVKWQVIAELFLRSLGVKTNDILWLDLVQSRKLDSFIVQRLSKAFVRMKRGDEKEAAITDIGSKFSLVNLFRGVNLFDIVFEAFGAKTFFCTLGKLNVHILEACNLSYVDVFKLQHAYSYCTVGLRGSDIVEHKNWYDKYYQTKTVKRNQNPRFDESFTLYVTSMDIQILVLKIYHSKHQLVPVLLGECELELCDLNFKEYDELDLWLPLIVPKGILDISLPSSRSKNTDDDTDVDSLNNIFSSTSLVQVDSISQQKQAPPTIVGSILGIGNNLKKITGNNSPNPRVGNVSVKYASMSTQTFTIPSKTDPMIHIKLRWEPHTRSDNNTEATSSTTPKNEQLFTFDEIMKEQESETDQSEEMN